MNKQIGWSNESNLLVDIINDLDRLIQVTSLITGGGGGVSSVSGTAGRITSTGGVNPVMDISSSYDALWQPKDTSLTSISAVSWVQGDIIYWSGVDTAARLVKDTNATRYLSNQGTSNNPSWNQVDLSNGVTGDLPYSNITQGSARSVLGVAGNATADVASIQGTADQILRVNGAGTDLEFGSIDLSKVAAVGSSILSVANGGTGSAIFPAYLLSSGGTATAANTFTFNTQDFFTIDGTWAATTGTSYNHISMTGSITARATASDTLRYLSFTPTLIATATTQTLTAVLLNPSFTDAGFTPTEYILRMQDGATDRFTFQSNGSTIFTTSLSGTAITFKTSTQNYHRFNENSSLFFGTTSGTFISAATAGTGATSIVGTAFLYRGDGGHWWTMGGSQASITLGSLTNYSLTSGFSAASGSNTGTAFKFTNSVNFTGGTPTVIGIDYDLTGTIGSATHYGMLIRSGRVGIGVSAPTAMLHLVAGTASANTSPLKFNSGTNLTTAETGSVEYDGTNLFFTRTGTTRENVICASAVNVVSPTAPNRTITVNIDGSTYYISAKTTND